MDKITVTRSSMPPYEEYIEKIKPLWDSHWLTNMGAYHKELEAKLKEFLAVKNVSLMVNGHMALEMAIQSFGFVPGSEVITTPFTFISTTHAIVRNNLTPVFCDIKESDYTLDESKIEKLITERTAAIIPVHVYGSICAVEKIREIADRHHLKVIYDAAHAFGENYNGAGVGNFGDASVFSFHATKVYNTIEGGAVTFSDPAIYERLYNLKNFGIRGEEIVEAVGANAKMNEFAAIMGLCNLSYVKQNIELRKQRVQWYKDILEESEKIGYPEQRAEQTKNYGYLPVLFESGELRDAVYQALREQDIYARKYFYPLTSKASCFGGKYEAVKTPVAQDVSERVLVLPLYPELEYEQIGRICKIIKSIIY